MVLLKPEAIIVFVVSWDSSSFRVIIEVKYLTAKKEFGDKPSLLGIFSS